MTVGWLLVFFWCFFKRVCLNFITRKGFHVCIWFLHEFFFFQKPSFARRRWCDRRLNNNIIFNKIIFQEPFFSPGANGVSDRLNNNVFFQTQEENYFSETFLRAIGSFFCRIGVNSRTCMVDEIVTETLLRKWRILIHLHGVIIFICSTSNSYIPNPNHTIHRKWRILIHFHGIIIFISWTTATGHSHPLSIRKQKLWDVSAVDTLTVGPLFFRSMF